MKQLFRALFALAGMAAGLLAIPAQAEEIYLKCGNEYPEHFVVDTERNTVNNNPARINQTTISWEVTQVIPGSPGFSETRYHTIDRQSGVHSYYGVMTEPDGRQRRSNGPPTQIPCEKESKPATKF